MARLKNKNMQIPGGHRFYVPQTKWSAPRFASFSTIVQAVISHRRGNPALCQRYGWSTDPAVVEREVEDFNVRLCQANGWNDYITEGASPSPKLMPSHSLVRSVRNAAAAAPVLVEWIKSGAEAVAPKISNDRAQVCSICPQNSTGDLTRFFTRPVSEAIRAALNAREGMKLSTQHDDKLGVCVACSCPLKLKVHLPIDRIVSKMDSETKAALDSKCWILSEVK